MHLRACWHKPVYTCCYPLIPPSDTLRSLLAYDDLDMQIGNIFFPI